MLRSSDIAAIAALHGKNEEPNVLSIPRKRPLRGRIGVFGVGYERYWSQFPGMRDELLAKQEIFLNKLRKRSVEAIDFGLIDNEQGALALLPKLLAADLDLLIIDMLTYATSSTAGILFKHLNIPIVLAAMQPRESMDYVTGTTHMQLVNDDFCAVPEFIGVAVRCGRKAPDLILGQLENDPETERQIDQWSSITNVLADVKRARFGHLGHVLESMLDMQTDPTAVTGAFGAHVVACEAAEMVAFYRDDFADEIEAKKGEILDFFDTPDPGSDPIATKLLPVDLHHAAKAAVALEKFIAAKEIDSLAYYYEGEPGSATRELVTNLIVGNSLLTSAGFPMCGEFDLKTSIAMMIFDRLGIGGSFAEFHVIDYPRNTILVGHDGPHHLNIADRKPVLRSLKTFHGKPGSGASVEFNIRKGPITMASLGVGMDGRFKFVVAEGESLDGPIPPTGNTNTHGRFGDDVRDFLRRWVTAGPTHHFALGVGHHAKTILKIADCFGIAAEVVPTR